MKNESSAINRLCDPRSKVSSHYFIKNNGNIIKLVPELYEAWHAGMSSWKKFELLNKYSIGIEIHNPGHENKYRKFSKKQISSLIKLLQYLSRKYRISAKDIIGHSDIAPNRKKDPGEKFPWSLLAKKKLSIWHCLSDNEIKFHRNLKISTKDEVLFIKNLYKIGYCKIKNADSNINKKYLVKAFQRRFRQQLINGKIDQECFLISKSLKNFR